MKAFGYVVLSAVVGAFFILPLMIVVSCLIVMYIHDPLDFMSGDL